MATVSGTDLGRAKPCKPQGSPQGSKGSWGKQLGHGARLTCHEQAKKWDWVMGATYVQSVQACDVWLQEQSRHCRRPAPVGADM
jgi:hypothetical protein